MLQQRLLQQLPSALHHASARPIPLPQPSFGAFLLLQLPAAVPALLLAAATAPLLVPHAAAAPLLLPRGELSLAQQHESEPEEFKHS